MSGSRLTVTNLSDGVNTLATDDLIAGAFKAWVTINRNAAPEAISDSLNLSSAIIGTSTFTMEYINNMADAVHIAGGVSTRTDTTAGAGTTPTLNDGTNDFTRLDTSGVQCTTWDNDTDNAATNTSFVNMMAIGDLA